LDDIMQKQTQSVRAAAAQGLNETHAQSLTSFVKSANDPQTHFPLQNLPLAVFRRKGSSEAFRIGAGIGDQIVDIQAVARLLEEPAREAALQCGQPSMNGLMALGAAHWSALRLGLSRLLREGSPHFGAVMEQLVAMKDAEFTLPMKIPNYTDYVASKDHISKVIKVKRPQTPEIPPSYVWTPLAYHGRASTIRPSGHTFVRPKGQTGQHDGARSLYRLTEWLDYEAELGMYIRADTEHGQSLDVDEAEAMIFGISVFNDWTARDIQGWEQFPLGPFQSKSFATTISPWVISMEALEPFRRPFERDASFPEPAVELDSDNLRQRGQIDVQVDILIQTERMAKKGLAPQLLGRSNLTDCYWSIAQMVAHQSANGCKLEAGDLIGTGTISGPELHESGCMMELTLGGKAPVTLSSGEKRAFVDDGDTVTVQAYCQADGFRRIGFGDAAATVVPNA
jgi:fumarylacetoacetase